MMMTLAAGRTPAAAARAGRRRATLASSACTPTRRTLQPGDLFVALQGERFDAHDFLAAGARPAARPPRWPSTAGRSRPAGAGGRRHAARARRDSPRPGAAASICR